MNSYNKKYIKSFDYLRILALLGVFLYHLMPNFVPSGYLGVVIFFVLAGFLTMKQCMDSEESKVSPVKKITDKIFKLYPALLFTIIVVIAFMFFYFRNFLIQLPVDAVSSVLSVNSYAQILRNESYFEAMNSIKPLTHIWALSLEFQFYVLFFLLVTPFYKKSNENKYLISFLLLTLLSIIISIFLVSKGVNLTRIYYGIDTRLSTFLLGAVSAVISSKISSTISRASGLLRLLKYILLFIMIYAMVVNFSSDTQVVGIIITYSVLVSALLVILYSDEIKVYEENYEINERQDDVNASNKNVLDKLSTLIVNRSYIIYLIHYPIIVFSNRFLAHANIDMKVFFIIILIVVLVASEVTYRLIQVLFFNHKDRKLSSVLIISMTLIVFASAFIMKNIVGDAPKLADKNDTTWLTETTEDEMLKYFTEQNDDEISRLLDKKPIVATDSLTTDLEEESAEGLYDEDGKLILSAEELNSYKIQTVFNRINKVNALVGGDATLTRDEFLEYRNMKISFIGDSVTQGSR
ncbi:MAG: acyltransferase, partial [Lachnospiraceae bacterium]|nr:acyltransferase [Lachnospiraceae bacterium]